MGDSYVEQLVKRQGSMLQMGIRVGAVVSAIIITYIMAALIGIISLIAAFAMGYGVYYIFIMTSVEYEYVLVNGELTVGYENQRSIEIKCDYLKKRGFRGAMIWRTELDLDSLQLARTVARCLLNH